MLTDTRVKTAKPQQKLYKLTDERGLHLAVYPTGSKLWQVRYRFEGKEKTASLGRYPDVGLAQAREKRDQLRKQLASEIDPVQAQRQARAAKKLAQENSFEAVALAWFAGWKAALSSRHADYVIRRLEADVFPVIGNRPVAEVQAPELVTMMKAVEKRGALDIAKRCYQMTGQVFRYAIAHGLAQRNPASDVKPGDVLASRRKENYARIDARELPELLRKIEGYQGSPATRLAIKLLALTFVRTSELIEARWEEFDLQAGQWRIPAERMKMRTPHIVPLSLQAIQTLQILYGGPYSDLKSECHLGLKVFFGDAKMTAARLDRLTHYCDIQETGTNLTGSSSARAGLNGLKKWKVVDADSHSAESDRAQPGYRQIHETAHFRRPETPFAMDDVQGQCRPFVIDQNNLQFACQNLRCDLI